jgi:hypothetical protein
MLIHRQPLIRTQLQLGGQPDAAKFNPSILRLLDLGLIWSDFAPTERRYAYHWTDKGKKALEKYGVRKSEE